MLSSLKTTWTCDFCDREFSNEGGELPKKWKTLSLFESSRPVRHMEICYDCFKEITHRPFLKKLRIALNAWRT